MAPPKYDKALKKQKKEKKLLEEYSEGKKILIQREILAEQKKNRRKKKCTISIAIPGSILDNRATPLLDAILAGQIARAAAIYQVDEIIVFDEKNSICQEKDGNFYAISDDGYSNLKLAKILQYLECPQYLRKLLYPIEDDLNYVGILHPMNMPHHLRASEWFPYREGLVTDHTPNKGSLINIGLEAEIKVKEFIDIGTRVTVKLSKDSTFKKVKGALVSSSEPQKELGVYWGYNVRMALSLNRVFTECPYSKDYDLIIGTSDKGEDVKSANFKSKYKHILIVFGGVKGLEASIESDEHLKGKEPKDVFQHYLNTRVNQGTRTIRTEEALMISLEAILSKLNL